jgi:hypothetical protein
VTIFLMDGPILPLTLGPRTASKASTRKDGTPMTNQNQWTTGNEITFIRNLGRHALTKSGMNRADLLRGYLVGARQRDRWDGIDREQVLGFASECLRQEMPN